jgi:predicted NBD/HSP70 family sugar kinase/DNA-binding MarR family transcriptional regulator
LSQLQFTSKSLILCLFIHATNYRFIVTQMQNNQTADQDSVRKVNTSLVLNALRLHAPTSRADLANLTKLNRSTISNIVNVLIDDGLVLELNAMESKIGRPGIALTLRPEGGAVIGIEIGVGFISVILTDFVATILWRDRYEFQLETSQIAVISKVEELVDRAIAFADSRQLRLLGIGLGVPGLVNVQNGELLFAPNLGWRDVPLRLMLSQKFPMPIYVENEANLGALGEYYFGVGRNGKLFKGGRGFAGEIGHIQRDPKGEMCGCGRRGCWETQVGPRAILQRVKRSIEADPQNTLSKMVGGDLEKLTFNQVVDCALQGDELCRAALENVGENLGTGVADLVNIFNPQMVIIGGAFNYGREIILPVLENTIADETLPSVRQDLEVIISDQGADATVLGAIAVVLDDILRSIALV